MQKPQKKKKSISIQYKFKVVKNKKNESVNFIHKLMIICAVSLSQLVRIMHNIRNGSNPKHHKKK